MQWFAADKFENDCEDEPATGQVSTAFRKMCLFIEPLSLISSLPEFHVCVNSFEAEKRLLT
jgi:hypothetical protein